MAEYADKSGGDNRTESGHTYGFCGNRLCGAPFCTETAVEHYKDKREHTYVFGKTVIVKRNAEKPVRAEQHTDKYKCKKNRHAELV